MKLYLLIGIALIGTGPVFARNEKDSVHWLRLQWDNDIVFQTDRYYTNGLKFEFYSSGAGHSFADYFHFNHTDYENAYYGFSFQQDIFTPQDKNSLNNQAADRPFASYILLASTKRIADPQRNLIRQSEIQIGMLGRYSGGAWLQNSIHNALPASAEVHGWDNQIPGDILASYGLSWEKEVYSNSLLMLNTLVESTIGLPYTFVGAGLHFRLGNNENYFSHSDFYYSNEIRSFFYGSMQGRFMAYNATIQGGLFKGPEADPLPINRFVYELESGIGISYRSFQFSLGTKMISPEFKNGSRHAWGYITFLFAL